MKILSLFDGISAAQVAINKLGVSDYTYYASEIDQHAINVTQNNYPNTIQLGDVTKVKGFDVDLLIGGSPCQGFSFAGKQLNFNDARSKLFFEYVRLLKECRPKYFLLENVMMKQEYQNVISELLGVSPIMINSNLVSAQNRKRLYWTNIPNISQPKDRGLLLKDVLEDGSNLIGRMTGRKINPATGKRDDYNKNIEAEQRIEPRLDNKSGTLTTVQKDNLVLQIPVIKSHGTYQLRPEKAMCIDANYWKGPDNHGQRTIILDCEELGHADINGHDFLKRVYSIWGKSPTLTAVCGGNQERKIAIDNIKWRKLTPIECERLQCFPDNYTQDISNTQRYKALGNSFTVDVIAHILSHAGLV